MKKCVIFCAGEFRGLLSPVETGDRIIAADGGLAYTQALGLKPDIILGDFDSLGTVPPGGEVFPVEKDDTDSMLAIKKGLALGCRAFWLYGAMDGSRLDHTVANFQALDYLAHRDARGFLIGSHQIATVIRNGSIAFSPDCRGYLSIFCMGPDAQGVRIRGAKYEAEDICLSAGFPLGVSNQFMGKPVTVSVEQGSLLLLWSRENGI